MKNLITCPICGVQFTAQNAGTCTRCPLHAGCAREAQTNPKVVCCPNCGAETINPFASKWASWAAKKLGVKTS